MKDIASIIFENFQDDEEGLLVFSKKSLRDSSFELIDMFWCSKCKTNVQKKFFVIGPIIEYKGGEKGREVYYICDSCGKIDEEHLLYLNILKGEIIDEIYN